VNRSATTSILLALSIPILLACQILPGPRGQLVMLAPTATATGSGTVTDAAATVPPDESATRQPRESPAAPTDSSAEGTPTPSFPDLNGVWADNGRLIVMVQNGLSVSAAYIEERICDHQDGSGATTRYRFDFNGTLALEGDVWTLSGEEFGVCGYGHDDPSRNGLILTDAQAVVSTDFNTISGDWYNSDISDWVVGGVHIVRQFEGGAAVPTPDGFVLPTASP